MTKKHFIALAEVIIDHNKNVSLGYATAPFTTEQISAMADFCRSENSQFDRSRWLGYIAGENGPSGGTVKGKK